MASGSPVSEFRIEDFKILNYDPDPAVKMPVAV
ncbi:thymidylate synthase [Leisingera thetidis]|nr:thymidylate synthase [Leisingera thetidis]